MAIIRAVQNRADIVCIAYFSISGPPFLRHFFIRVRACDNHGPRTRTTDARGENMKKLTIALLIVHYSLLIASPSHAIKLCKQGCFVPSPTWRNDYFDIGGEIDYRTGTNNAPWALFNIPGGEMRGVAKCTAISGSYGQTYDDSQSGSPTGYGLNCWCRVTSINGNTCNPAGPWVYGLYADPEFYSCYSSCSSWCAYCAQSPNPYFCSRSLLLSELHSEASAVTCPANGTCTHPNYKTVADDEECGAGSTETTSPALTISGDSSDDKGTLIYGACVVP